MNPTLEWMYAAELATGGLSAWRMPNGHLHSGYIECTGYSLPTLIKHGAVDLALRCADWLIRAQNPDGSFDGLDGLPRPFDTAAVIEGLEAVYHHTGTAIYRAAANRAVDWMRQQITPGGTLKNSVHNAEACIYNLRASAIIGNKAELEYWQARGLIHAEERSHYMAYALEGLLNFGAVNMAEPYLQLAYDSGNLLQPFKVSHSWQPIYADFDICASCQMALLFLRMDWDVSKHYEAIQRKVHSNGGVPQSTSDEREILWAAKYLLDLVHVMEGVTA